MTGKTILIVEDDVALAGNLQKMLKRLGHAVSEPAAVRDAASAVKNRKPDLILMDIELQMGRNETAAAGKVRDLTDKPVIFLTGHSCACPDTEPYGCLVKPVTERELSLAVEFALQKYELGNKIREAEDRLNDVQAIADTGSFVWSLREGSLEWSPNMYSIAGMDPGSNNGGLMEKIVHLIHEEDLESVKQQIHSMVEQRKTWPVEFRIVRPDGEVLWIRSIGRIVFDEKGIPIELKGVNQNITKQKEAQRALQESEDRYRRITESITDYIFTVKVKNRKAVETVHGEACVGITGYTADEFRKDPYLWINIVHGDDRGKVIKQAEDILKKRTFESIEHRIMRKDGSIRWVRNNPVPTFDQKGNLLTYDGLIRDITERKRAEEALRASEELFRNTFEQAAVGMSLLTSEGRWLSINQRLCDILGYSQDELMSLDFRKVTHPDHLQGDVERVRQMVKGKRNADSWEKRYIRKDGKIIWVRITTSLLRQHDGRPDYFVTVTEDITRRKEDEQRLQESEEKFSSIYKLSPEIVIISRFSDGTLLDFNEAFERQTGYSRDEALGRTSGELGLWGDLQERERIIRRFRKLKGRMNQFEVNMRRKDQSIFTVILSATDLELRGEKVLLVIATDISERKKSEMALRKSEERYQKSQKIGHVGGWEYDLKTTRFWGSEEALRMFGFDPDRAEHTTDEVEGCIQERERVHQTLTDLIEEGKEYNLEYVILPGNSTEPKIIWSIAELQRDENGNPSIVIGVIQDITERKKTENALRESEEHLQSLFMNMAEGVALHDLILNESGEAVDYRIVDVNPRYEQIMGVKKEDIQGKLATEIYGDSSAPYLREYSGVALNGTPANFDTYYQPMDRYFDISVAPWGKLGFAIIFTDITEARHAEEELGILTRQIQQAQKLEAIGTLAGGIAHDFNNILSAIIGYSELALDDLPRDGSLYGNLQEVIKAGDRAKDLVKQILTFSRRDDMEKRPVRVSLLVKEALKLLRSTIPSSITITRQIDSSAGTVLANPTHIHQVIMNLCTNAYHAMMPDGGEMTVALDTVLVDAPFAVQHSPLHEGPYLKLTVNDTGTGMDHETLDRIFDPFFTTKEKGTGTGLGLATVHGIIAGMNGAILVKSTVGMGSTFEVYMPLVTGEADDLEEKTGLLPMGKGEMILLVDDEEAVLRFTSSILERLGYRATSCSSSLKALELIQADPSRYDLMLTDQTMPGMTGVKLTAETHKIRPDMPVILMTGYSESISGDQITGLGIAYYLEKPFTKKAIGEALRQCLHAGDNREHENP